MLAAAISLYLIIDEFTCNDPKLRVASSTAAYAYFGGACMLPGLAG
jgi:hypothetical protein